MDVHTKKQRSYNMSRIKNRDTKPEMIVRRLVYSLGFRYRLHLKDLPGKPDLVFKGRKKVIFVHGCYWHMHDCRYGRVTPRTNAEFWRKKRESNVTRDKNNIKRLQDSGWEILVIWECETREPEELSTKIKHFLENSSDHP